MRTKWEYIALRCQRKGLCNSARIAKRIDRVLQVLYGRKHTTRWKDEYKSLGSISIVSIAEDSDYCIACVEHDTDCDVCNFAKVAGKCIGDFGLYKRFIKALITEGGV